MNADLNQSTEDVSKTSIDFTELPKSNESTPMRVTTPLELLPNSDKADIARKQLENLSKKPRRRQSPAISDRESTPPTNTSVFAQEKEPTPPVSEVLYSGKPTMTNLSSAIISKEELEDEIRKKIVKSESPQLPILKKCNAGEIEIPQELILSELTASASAREEGNNVAASQLDGQELIDILEGKQDEEEEGQMFEVYGRNGMFIVKSENSNKAQTTSYEIISTEDENMAATKQKLLEREIAMRQIASMPTRKNRKLKNSTPPGSTRQQQSLAQSLAMDWSDKEEEVILELENVGDEEENGGNESKIKILNMTILNESSEEIKPRAAPKILNKNAPKPTSSPKILNINAPQAGAAGEVEIVPKSGRVIRKRTIWDPSQKVAPVARIPVSLPPAITIKKLTKETITSANISPSDQQQVKKTKKKSEVDRLFQDEGAVNMIYSLERQNNNVDVPEIDIGQKALIDKTEEKSTLIAKAKTIKQTIIKQSTSPPEVKTTPRQQRVRRDLTPSTPERDAEKKSSPSEAGLIIKKIQKTSSPVGGRKKKVDDTWDFVRKAQTTCDDAMIIRRRSNSSYSSSAPTSPRRLSVDQSFSDTLDESAFKFTKPQEKKTPEMQKDLKSCVGGLVEELRNTISSKLSKGGKVQPARGKKRATSSSVESPPPKRLLERRMQASEKECQITKFDGVAHIVLNSNPLTINLLGEVKSALSQLENDEDCKVVMLTPFESFSLGLDYSTLFQTTVDKRKQAASDLVTAVK
jgi:hypothetical protein